MDIVDANLRSRMMSGIGSKNTKPELLIRKTLHQRGLRFRLHEKKLPGKPDLVLAKYHCVIFVQGCFWHVHECHLFRWPKTREDFWRKKLGQNRLRDAKNLSHLKRSGWRAALVWECALRDASAERQQEVIDQLERWIRYGGEFLSLPGDDWADKIDDAGFDDCAQ